MMGFLKKKQELTTEEYLSLMGDEILTGRIWTFIMNHAVRENRFDAVYLAHMGFGYVHGFCDGRVYPTEEMSTTGYAQYRALKQKCITDAYYIAGHESEIRELYDMGSDKEKRMGI
ncbi:hypothetical protein [Methanorbis furvi]|uniref:Uncharacterized protein n=1 Tax=Methanorbis furvi TaxID=3028299 RepID=A0AAE4MDG8_9EURY|nr:hypothetical protein [Methanocorpusculaceae archaeon Ag1]